MPTRDLPIRVTAHQGPWPWHDAAASRALEQAALARAEPGALMGRAGLSVARLAAALAPHAARVKVWAGPGNNGGDGLVAALHLHRAGRQVTVHLIADPARLPVDAARALQAATSAGVAVHASGPAPAGAALVIDALLGLGTTRAPAGDLAQAIAHINEAGAPVLAVDIPSGLHPDTGTVLGDAAVRARATLALLTLKPGCFTHQGRDHAGEVWLDTLGVPARDPSGWLTSAPAILPRAHATHKGSLGDVAVVGGAAGMVGAAWLAAGAALAAGAGRVYCSLLIEGVLAPPPGRPELMMRAALWRAAPALLSATTVVCGCGGGDSVRQALPALLSHAGRLVLDADALNAIAADPDLQTLLGHRAGRRLPTLLTPHPLEAARLLACSAAEVQRDRIGAAAALAARHGASVLLKGSGTVIASPGRLALINGTGNAALACPGTGDVLAGWAGGLWAQQPDALAADVAAAAAWQHGQAADNHAHRLPGRPLRAMALIEAMMRVTGAELAAARR